MKWHHWYLLGYLFSLPNTLLGLVLALVYWPRQWRFSGGCIEAVAGDRIFGKPGAQTWGFLIYYRDEHVREVADLRVHERVHVVQGFYLGPLFLVAYGLHFVWLWVAQGFGDWRAPYHRVWAERQAYQVQDEYIAGQRSDAWGAKP